MTIEDDISIGGFISNMLFFITSLRVNKEKLLIDIFSLFLCLRVQCLTETKIEIESRLHCIDIIDDDCSMYIFYVDKYMIIDKCKHEQRKHDNDHVAASHPCPSRRSKVGCTTKT